MNIELPPRIAEILRTLNNGGFEAYIVGGCVRDCLLGHAPGDWDVTTNARPDQIKLCFSGRRVIETGLKHGTVTVILEGMPTEITTYRIDGDYSDFRRPDSVEFTNDLRADLSRRDFTMNALAYHPEKGLADYFGGRDDVAARRIVCVGDAKMRFSEDALRVLRAVRFASVLGFSIEERTESAMLELAPLLDKISAERVASELSKALTGKYIADELLSHTAIFTRIIPELEPEIGLCQRTPYHHLDVWRHTVEAVRAVPDDLILRLTMLLHDIGKPETFTVDEQGKGHFYGHARAGAAIADAILERLRYDNATRKRVVYLIERHCDMLSPEPKRLKRTLNRMGEEALRQLIAVKRADHRAKAPEYRAEREDRLDEIERALDEVIGQKQAFLLKDLAVDGNDLIGAGFAPGKELGAVLGELLNLVMDEQLPNEREALLEAAKRML